jgi:hypothetical protein
MWVELLERALWVIFVISVLNIVRHTYFFIQSWVKSTDEQAEKYFLSFKSLLLLGLSIGYFVTVIIRGISL